MNSKLTLPAPGKLNLFLHVTGRRRDGYHTLQTLFQLVDYCDELTFEPVAGGEIDLLGDLAGVPPQENLIHRAARLLQQRAEEARGARITVTKRLPVGGGMGGGSSDAATTLVALNRLWQLRLSSSELASLALELGADVPLFVLGKSAWGEGIGEKLTPVELAPRWYLIVVPGGSVATAEVFASPRLTRDTPPITIADFLAGAAHAGSVGNDCESVVRSLSTEVDEALRWLSQWGPARMTGTGSCVFLTFDDREHAEETHARLPGDWRGIVARGINDSPLHVQADMHLE